MAKSIYKYAGDWRNLMLYATASGEIYFCMLQTLAKSISKDAADSGEIYCWTLGTQGEIYCSRLDSMGCLLLVLQYTRLQPVVAGEEFVLNSVFILDVDLPCRLSVFKQQIGTGTDTVILTQCHGHCTVHCTPNSHRGRSWAWAWPLCQAAAALSCSVGDTRALRIYTGVFTVHCHHM